MEKQPITPQNQKDNSDSGGCVPMITTLIGLGMILVGLLAVFNTAFGWELVLEVYGSPLEIPKYWDSTIAVLVVGGIIAGIGWVMGRPRVIRFYRKNKLLTILGSVALLVGVFLLLNEYDKSLRRSSAAKRAQLDSLNTAQLEAEEYEEEPAYNPYADREITYLVTNPTVDTLTVYVDGAEAFTIKPYEIGKGKIKSGVHQLEAKVGDKTLETVDLDLPERTEETRHEITVLNIDSFFNNGVLNFQDYFDSSNRKKKGAKTINYLLQSLNWHEHIFTIDVESPSLTLPRHPSIDISSGTALKLVLVPDELESDESKAFDYLIWKFIDEETKGFMQDDLDFFMLKGKKRDAAIRNRLKDDLKRFEKENSSNN